MQIDGHSLWRREVLEVNAVIDKIWDSMDTDTVKTNEDFIQASWGPDAIELLNGGADWVVCDRPEPNAVIYHEGRTTWIASRELFQVCAKFSPLERITWHLENQKPV